MRYGEAALAGELSFLGLADVFQVLGGNNGTGTLRITSKYAPGTGLIYFSNGNPVNATIGSLRGIDAIYALFGWTEGKFEFHEQDVQVEHAVNNSRMEIILDALRLLDDGKIPKVGPPSPETLSVSPAEATAWKEGKGEALPVIKGPLIDYTYVVNEETYHGGETIAAEGGHGTWIWVILEGMVRITRETSNGPVTIVNLGEGGVIGNLGSFLRHDHIRNASATAVGDVQLGVLDAERLFSEYSCLSSEFREFLLSLDSRLEKMSDRVVELFTERDKLSELIRDKKIVIKEGSSKKEAFVITEGQACVARRTPQGYFPLLALGKGDVFGFVPFIDMGHEPRRASVLGSKDLKVNKLDVGKLQEEYEKLSSAFKGLIENVASCVSVTTRLAIHLQGGK